MARCLQLAKLGAYYVAPNPMVGAVLVDSKGKIIGEGWHQRYGGPHAEVNCFASAEKREDYSDCTLYVSLEPCSHWGKTPPCALLLTEKKVGRVVAGMLDPNPQVSGKGMSILREAGIKTETGVLEKECRELNKRFLCLMEKNRPYVILKWAQTSDGYLDRRREEKGNGPVVISSKLTKQLVHKKRAENMAIMVGTRTALLDDPKLKTTHWSGRNPLRVVTDRHHRLTANAQILSPDAETIVYSERTDWPYILNDLAARHIHSILVEGGSEWLNHILSTGIWDEIHIEEGPHTLAELTADQPQPVVGVAAPKADMNQAICTRMENQLLYEIRKQ
ncbi:MAG: bifunctional diaminohydroxyphosphoribosylaminopyrimidine deaminase/5-amino-6-(5-phosphoribosylamino)uracil reductase RibD [Paludibacteraceae bacterium]|nr:bifunctional diaminohydroxyphosphoribosylaminopyrimidine deaminase/5-amino-6-(5-phosphoribosylamino)uracil reductase RibD [Paludibacteraceae bacterium]